jgi:hypothetical protein
VGWSHQVSELAFIAAMAISAKAGSEPVLALIEAPSPTRGLYYDRFTATAILAAVSGHNHGGEALGDFGVIRPKLTSSRGHWNLRRAAHLTRLLRLAEARNESHCGTKEVGRT